MAQYPTITNIKDLRQCPEALDTLASWHHQEWASLNPGQTLGDRQRKMQEYLESCFVPSTFVASNSGEQILGSAAIISSDMETRPELSPWLASVFVVPEFRKQGVGSDLVKHVMKEAKLAGFAKLYLFTPDQERFYENLGWSILESTDYRNHQVTIMYCEL